MKTNDPESRPPRYTDLPLPGYRHVPGDTPHPTRDPAGHSYGRRPVWAGALQDLNAADPGSCPAFLYGVDLFNAEYWWECHEVLEDLWNVAGHQSAAANTLQAVIQCSAAHLKVLSSQIPAARKLLDHAVHHAKRGADRDLGLDLARLVSETRAHIAGGPSANLVLLEPPG